MGNVDSLADLSAERSLLAACMHSPSAYAEAAWIVSADHFHRGSHATLWQVVSDLRTSGDNVDLVAVCDELASRGWTDHVGGDQAVADVAGAAHTGAGAARSARVVYDLARRRHVAALAGNLHDQALDRSVDLDSAVADTADAIAGQSATTPTVPADALVEQALATADRGSEQFGWPAPWGPLAEAWRIVPGWLHVAVGWRSHGKSALCDALVVGLARNEGVRTLMWSPEGAPSGDHLLRLARVHAGSAMHGWSDADRVEQLQAVTGRVSWIDHAQHTTLPRILAAADAHRLTRGLDLLVVDPFTSVDKFDGPRDEGWDRVLNRHLSRLQNWVRSRQIAALVVAHPKQRERLSSGLRPVATDADIAGGAMWSNQVDSLVSVWRDEQGLQRDRALVDVYVQKVRDDGPGGKMGRKAQLVRTNTGDYTSARQQPQATTEAA